MYIRSNTDPDTEESEDELPAMKSYLEKARQHHADTMETVSVAKARDTAWGLSRTWQIKSGQLFYMMSCIYADVLCILTYEKTMLGPKN